MNSKKTPLNKREVNLNNQKIRRMIIMQNLKVKSLERENEKLKRKIRMMESTLNGPYKFFYKLAYACEVILNIVKIPFGRKDK